MRVTLRIDDETRARVLRLAAQEQLATGRPVSAQAIMHQALLIGLDAIEPGEGAEEPDEWPYVEDEPGVFVDRRDAAGSGPLTGA